MVDQSTLVIGTLVALVAAVAAYKYLQQAHGSSNGLPTTRQAQLVTSTWEKVKTLGPQDVGVLLFQNLFAKHPEGLGLFKKFGGDKDWVNNPAFRAHALNVVTHVDTAISLLGDLDTLVPVLQKLGNSHIKYGVKPEHYDWVGEAFLTTLGQGLKEDFTPEVKDAYIAVYGTVASVMMGDNYKK